MSTTATEEQGLGQGRYQEQVLGRKYGHPYAAFLSGLLLEYAIAMPANLATPAVKASARITAMAQQGLCNQSWDEWMPFISEPDLALTAYALQWMYDAGCATIAAADAAGIDCDVDLSVVHWVIGVVQAARTSQQERSIPP